MYKTEYGISRDLQFLIYLIFCSSQVFVLLRLAKDDDEKARTANLVTPVLSKDPRLASGKVSQPH